MLADTALGVREHALRRAAREHVRLFVAAGHTVTDPTDTAQLVAGSWIASTGSPPTRRASGTRTRSAPTW